MDQDDAQEPELTTMEKVAIVSTYAALVQAINQSGTPR